MMIQFAALLLLVGSVVALADDRGNLTDRLESFHAILKKLPGDMFEIELDLEAYKEEDQDELVAEADEQASAIRKKLGETSNEVYELRILAELLIRRKEKKQEEEEKEKEEKEEEDRRCGTWNLGMNLNPSDGHVMGYETGWSDDSSIGSLKEALIKDYLNQTVWNTPANHIAIVRHHQGALDAVKVFTFKHWGLSLSHRFKDTDPGRNVVSEGGPVQVYTTPGAHNLVDDPIFSVGGDLAFNWGYSRNGARLVLTGGHLSGADVDDDNTHGFGNNFWVRPKMIEDPEASPGWAHEISNNQDCPYPSCTQVTGVKIQGTDHGSGSTLKGGPVYGNYALYVSDDVTSFPTDGLKLGTSVIVCENKE